MRNMYPSHPVETNDDETLQHVERRSASRMQMVMRVGRVITEHDEGFARLKNISDQGAQLRLQIPVMLGETLTLELSENVALAGQVVWTAGPDCGIKFDQYTDCGELLARLAAESQQGLGRPLRLPVAKSAITRGANGTRLANVVDISQRGMKLKHDGSFVEGLRVKVTLPSGLERQAVVRWSKDNIAGLMLLEPFSAEDLGSARNL